MYVFAPVLVPNLLDKQKQWVSKETIRQACYDFMEKYGDAGYRHKALLAKSAVVIVENEISKEERTYQTANGPKTYPVGTWFQGHLVFSKELMEQIESGRLTGFSIGGRAAAMKQHLPSET